MERRVIKGFHDFWVKWLIQMPLEHLSEDQSVIGFKRLTLPHKVQPSQK